MIGDSVAETHGSNYVTALLSPNCRIFSMAGPVRRARVAVNAL
jgi:hypothetical protein